jgi:hypothetical protein
MRDASRRTGGLKRVIAPALSVALLVTMIARAGVEPQRPPGVEAYHARVREAVKAIPFGIDSWIGEPVETSLAAVRLLRPNILMERRYTDPQTGASLGLLVVHCTDVRDMIGHYPPNCYPASGWQLRSAAARSIPTEHGDYPATEYRFVRAADGLERPLAVTNFFVLPRPDAQVFPDIDAVNRAARGKATAGLGAAQIQVLGGESLPPERRAAIVAKFIQAIEPAIRVIATGANGG